MRAVARCRDKCAFLNINFGLIAITAGSSIGTKGNQTGAEPTIAATPTNGLCEQAMRSIAAGRYAGTGLGANRRHATIAARSSV